MSAREPLARRASLGIATTKALLDRPTRYDGAWTGHVRPRTTSRRQIPIGGEAIEALRAHRKAQTEERLRVGPAWQDNDLVFSTAIGTPIDGGDLLRAHFYPLLARAGLPRVRFHDLRHTAATLLLAAGTHPKIVAERLGHSTPTVTLNVYSHVTPTMQREAAATLDRVLGA
jgi:integrase